MDASSMFSTPFHSQATFFYPQQSAWHPPAVLETNAAPLLPPRILQPKPVSWRMSPDYDYICAEISRVTKVRAAAKASALPKTQSKTVLLPSLVKLTLSTQATVAKQGRVAPRKATGPPVVQQRCFYPPPPKASTRTVRVQDPSPSKSTSGGESKTVKTPAPLGMQRAHALSTSVSGAGDLTITGYACLAFIPWSLLFNSVGSRPPGLPHPHDKTITARPSGPSTYARGPRSLPPSAGVVGPRDIRIQPLSTTPQGQLGDAPFAQQAKTKQPYEAVRALTHLFSGLYTGTFKCYLCSDVHIGARAHYEHMCAHVSGPSLPTVSSSTSLLPARL